MINAPGLEFDAAAHRYLLDGQELPGVTRVLKSAGLIDDTWFSDDARQRGSYVHAAAHFLDDDDLDEATVDPRYAGYLDAYRLFRQQTNPTWEYVEHRVCDPVLRYAGTLDRAGGLVTLGTGRVLIDLKSGGLPASAGLQTAAYRRCLPEPHTWKRAALQLRADGTYRLEPLTDRKDEQRFLAALDLWHWKQAHLPGKAA